MTEQPISLLDRIEASERRRARSTEHAERWIYRVVLALGWAWLLFDAATLAASFSHAGRPPWMETIRDVAWATSLIWFSPLAASRDWKAPTWLTTGLMVVAVSCLGLSVYLSGQWSVLFAMGLGFGLAWCLRGAIYALGWLRQVRKQGLARR